MKKKSILLVALSTLMAASLGLGVLTACNSAEEVKASEYVNGTNFYYGDGQDVHLQGWITSVTNDAWTVEEGFVDEDAEGAPVVTKLGYSKNDAWRNFGVKIDGNYSDFSYLNITMRAETRGLTPGAVNVNMKIVNPIPEKDGVNVLGSDLYFDVSMDTYTTYSFQIPSIYREILDVTNDVCLFPEPGIANSDVIHAGDIYVKDMWFSKERPADGVTPVDDTWRTEAWCGYEVTRGGESEAIISYNRPADWSRFYRPVPYDEIFLEDGTVNNMLKLQFTSDDVTIGDIVYEDSVEQFQIGLWGNADPSSDGGYYQSWFGQYYRDKYEDTNDWSNNPAVFKVEKDEETGVVTLYCQVAPALIAMAGNFDEQIWICFNLESQPQGGGSDQAPGYIHGPVEFDGIGQMTILSSEFYFDKNEPVYSEPDPEPDPDPVVNDSGWNSSVAGAYTVSSEKAGVIANVTYKDLAPNMWCCVAYAINGTAEGNTLTIQLKNNGVGKVLYGIDWNSEATRQYGYIEPGATAEIELQNADMTGPVNLFLDSCYPGYDSSVTDPHSGDVDIVSMAFTNEEIAPPEEPDDPDPVVNDSGWNSSVAGAYTVSSEKAGVIANVTYKDLAPDKWCCVAYAINGTAEGNTLTIQLKNNGEEKVLYGIDWNSEATRQYGYIEPGATAEIELQNEAMTGPVNLFLDSCYLGYDPSVTDPHSGDVDIVSMEFTNEEIAPPEEPDEPDSDPSALNWTTNAANLSVKDGVVTLNNLMDGAWQDVNADLTLDAGGKITIPVTNNTNAIAKFKLSVMYNNDQGGWSDLEGNGTTICWLEIPKGETWNMELTVSASDAPKVAHIMLIVACWEKNGTQADGTTPRPEPPYTGTVTIGEMKFTPDATQPPVSEGAVVNVTWGTTAANLSVSEKTVTLNNLPIGTWQNVNADLTLSGACKVTLSITNNTGDVAKFKLQLMDAAWKQIGGDSDPCVCWMEIASGETMELTLTVTAEQAARATHIMLMVNCWVSGDVVTGTEAPCPAGPYTGNIVLGDVKVS